MTKDRTSVSVVIFFFPLLPLTPFFPISLNHDASLLLAAGACLGMQEADAEPDMRLEEQKHGSDMSTDFSSLILFASFMVYLVSPVFMPVCLSVFYLLSPSAGLVFRLSSVCLSVCLSVWWNCICVTMSLLFHCHDGRVGQTGPWIGCMLWNDGMRWVNEVEGDDE